MGRMWLVLEWVAMIGLVLLAITEVFYPLLAGRPLFGSFRKRRPTAAPDIDDELRAARRKVDDVKEVQRKADEQFRRAEDRKNAADDLLN
jgi:hypothetical protein